MKQFRWMSWKLGWLVSGWIGCCTLLQGADTDAPRVVEVFPPSGVVTQLTQITVTFSEPVTGVDAQDLLLNEVPASGLSGAGASYTFFFAQPAYGGVAVTWFTNHGISDLAEPAHVFDAQAPGNTWLYELVDTTPPHVAAVYPLPGATVGRLGQIEVTFTEPVVGVDAGDLLINGSPATNLVHLPGGPYLFQFPEPAAGVVQIEWAADAGIGDLARLPNPFVGQGWGYVFTPGLQPGDVVISEFLAANVDPNGLRDEDGELQDWIEIHNHGALPVDLAGWALSDDAGYASRWVFPSLVLAPGERLVVFASGKDRRTPLLGGRLHTNFKLSVRGEHLGLYSPDAPRRLVSGFEGEYPEQRNDVSYGRTEDGTWQYQLTPTPGAPNSTNTAIGMVAPVHVSAGRGFYTAPFDLALTTPTRGAVIRYTLDGSTPTATHGFVYSEPIRITNTTILRAAAFKDRFLPSPVETHTYIFNASAAIRSLPVLSIVTDPDNLYGPTGILGINGGRYVNNVWEPVAPGDYHNPSQRGIAWERPTSLELIDPEDNSGFQVYCGLRVHGSTYIRPRYTPTSKFSFRVYFRSDYGPGWLEYPLIPDIAVTRFDSLVLRGGHNDRTDPFIRDELTRQLLTDEGQVTVSGIFANLFVNGEYKGYYNPTERVEAGFMQDHYNSENEWDVIAPAGDTVDGDRAAFNALDNYIGSHDPRQPAVYQEIMRQLDLTNFVDYLLVNVYSAMGDWPHNNWRAARERTPEGFFRFYAWDCEWAMGIYNRSVTLDTFAMDGNSAQEAGLGSTNRSEIARFYQRLRLSPEFRLLFADRIHKHFFNDGALTDANIVRRFREMQEVMRGVLPNMDTSIINSWVPQRRSILMGQFDKYGLLASSNAPVFSQHGGLVPPGYELRMTTADPNGTIYYTTNGTDPRVMFSGEVAPDAIEYQEPIVLRGDVRVCARTRSGQSWSALAEADFRVATLGVPLRITEIHYNPAGGMAAHEFLELRNLGGVPLDVSGMHFTDGVEFQFPADSVIPPGGTIVLISNLDPPAFAARYPDVAVDGMFRGNLANGGERLTLVDATGGLIVSVRYDDEGAWPTEPDGAGPSLEIVDPWGDPNDPANWRASAVEGGTPGSWEAHRPAVVINECMADNVTAVPHGSGFPDWIELLNTGGAPVNLAGWSLTDNDNPRQFVFPDVTLQPGQYLVVWCDQDYTAEGLHTGFGLSHAGETLLLYDAATNRVDGVTFGAQLTDYSVGRVDGVWQLTLPTPGAANTAAQVAPFSDLTINEWMANPPPGEQDYIELFNRSTNQPVSLRGYSLGTSESGPHPLYELSFLPPGGLYLLQADGETTRGHLPFRLPASGTTLTLYDPVGAVVEQITYGAQQEGLAYGRIPDGSSRITRLAGSASPGQPNYLLSYRGPLFNEVMARNAGGVTDSQGRVADWVELYNPGSEAFDLTGMSMSVDEPDSGQWFFPSNTVIPASGFLVIWCDPNRPASMASESDLNLGRALDGQSGAVYLFSAAGQQVDAVEYGFQIENMSIGRVGATWRLLEEPSPGGVNGATVTLGSPAGLRFNEWMAAPLHGDDWFELYNDSDRPVSLEGLYLSDDPSQVGQRRFEIPALSFIAPHGWVRFVADGQPSRGRDHVNFSLDASGETLVLSAPALAVLDEVTFGLQRPGVSQGRLPDGASRVVGFAGSATPAEANYQVIPDIVISEVLTHGVAPLEDAIELQNVGLRAISIGGWYLTDDPAQPRKYRIPDGTVLAPGEFWVVYEAAFNIGSAERLILDGGRAGELWLIEMDGLGQPTGRRQRAWFGPSQPNRSWIRHLTPLGVRYVPAQEPTFGIRAPASIEEFRLGQGASNAAPAVGPVVISEIMYHPPESENAVAGVEFIELQNLSDTTITLGPDATEHSGWGLSGGVTFRFPPGANVPARERIVVVDFDPELEPAQAVAFRTLYGVPPHVPLYGPFTGRLDNDEDVVVVYRPGTPDPTVPMPAGAPTAVLVDRVHYWDSWPWPTGGVDGDGYSLQRREPAVWEDDPLSWTAGPPTPGQPNSPGVPVPPRILHSPASRTVIADTDVMLEAEVLGSEPLMYQWWHNGLPIVGATNAVLSLDLVQVEDAGEYRVWVSNPGGTAQSEPAILTVNAPPVITAPPQDAFVPPGTNVTFTVAARGSEPLHYQWYFQGEPVLGANGPSLNLPNVQPEHNGEYTVEVSNMFDTVRATAVLGVLIRPTLTAVPLTQTVPEGGSVTFSAAVTGSPPPFLFQWRFFSQVLTSSVQNATVSFFRLDNVQLNQSGLYRIVVSNAATIGPGIYNQARLTVLPDADRDGLPDEWEIMRGLNPNDPADALNDSDGDGLSERDEYEAGTDPDDASSFLRIDHLGLSPEVQLSFTAVSNRTYTVLAGPSLEGPWSRLADVLAMPTNRVVQVTDTNRSSAARFYRLRTPWQP